MAQQQTQRQRLPWSTFTLCGVLLLGLLGNLTLGNARQQEALNQYLSSGLFDQETPLYLDYQSRQHRVQQTVDARSLELVQKHLQSPQASDYAWLVMQDRNFVRYLNTQGSLFMPDIKLKQWQQSRQDFHQNHLSLTWPERYGVKPETPSPATFISHLFVSQNWSSLLLTLLLLCLLLPIIEARLGHASIPTWFLVSGSLYAMLYSMTASASSPILMGASGAASGLAGLAVGVIALSQQSLKSKAITSLAVMALASGKLLLEAWLEPASELPPLCHSANFILCVAIYVLLFSAKPQTRPTEEPDANSALGVRQGLNEVFKLIEEYDFPRATESMKRLKELHPTNIRVAKHAYLLAKLDPQSASFKEDLDAYIVAISLHDDYYSAKILLAELVQISRDELIDSQKVPSLIHLFASHNDLKKAELSFQLYQKIESREPLINEAKALLYQEFEKRNLRAKMSQYQA